MFGRGKSGGGASSPPPKGAGLPSAAPTPEPIEGNRQVQLLDLGEKIRLAKELIMDLTGEEWRADIAVRKGEKMSDMDVIAALNIHEHIARYILSGYYDKSMSMASNAKAFLGKEELVDLIADSMKKLKRKMQSKDKQSKDDKAEPEEEAGDPVHVRRKMQFILLVESMVEETRVQFMAEAFQRKGDGGAIKWEDDLKRCMRDIEENLEQHRSTEAAQYNVDTYLRSVFSTFMDLRAATHRKWEIFLQQRDAGANRGVIAVLEGLPAAPFVSEGYVSAYLTGFSQFAWEALADGLLDQIPEGMTGPEAELAWNCLRKGLGASGSVTLRGKKGELIQETANRVDSTLESLTTGAKKGKKKETLMSSWMGPDYSKLCARGLVERNDLEVVQINGEVDLDEARGDPTKMDMQRRDLLAEDIVILAEALTYCNKLQKLDLRHNQFGEEGSRELARAVGGLANLTWLSGLQVEEGGATWSLRDKTGLKPHEEAFISTRILVNTQLTSLNTITASQATEDGKRWDLKEQLAQPGVECAFVANVMRLSLTSLTSLDASSNALGGGRPTAILISGMPTTLAQLNISSCMLGSDGVFSLAAELPRLGGAGKGSLTDLDLSMNDCGYKGAEALAATVTCLGSLTRLVFGGNDIGERGCRAMASALRWGEGSELGARLQTLDLNDNGAGEAGLEALELALIEANALKFINFSDNNVPKDCRAATALLDAKKSSGCVVKLEDRKVRVSRVSKSRAGSPERPRSRSRGDEGAWDKSPDRGQNDATRRMLAEKPPPEVTVPKETEKAKFAASPNKKR